MASKSEGDLPDWFPFALAASVIVMIAAGSKSGWRLGRDVSPPPPPPPPPNTIQRAGVLRDWIGVNLAGLS